MKVTITQPTRHDGRRYAPGDTPDLPKVAALELITCGAAEAARRSPQQDAPSDPAPSSQDALSDPATQPDAPLEQG